MKKVLVLTGSYNKKGKTFRMTEEFIKGAEDTGHEVVRFDAAFMNLIDCKGCNACWKNGEACVFDKEFNKIAKYLETCDTLFISSPVYWINMTANLRMIIDHLYAYGGSGGPRPLTIKDTYFVICGEDPREDEYKPIKEEWKMCNDFLGWNMKEVIHIGGLSDEEKIKESKILERCYEMGRNI